MVAWLCKHLLCKRVAWMMVFLNTPNCLKPSTFCTSTWTEGLFKPSVGIFLERRWSELIACIHVLQFWFLTVVSAQETSNKNGIENPSSKKMIQAISLAQCNPLSHRIVPVKQHWYCRKYRCRCAKLSYTGASRARTLSHHCTGQTMIKKTPVLRWFLARENDRAPTPKGFLPAFPQSVRATKFENALP